MSGKSITKFITGSLVLICILVFSLVLCPTLASAAPNKDNSKHISASQTKYQQKLQNLWLQFQNYVQRQIQQEMQKNMINNGQHQGHINKNQNNGLHTGVLHSPQMNQQLFNNLIYQTAEIARVKEKAIVKKLLKGNTLAEIAKRYNITESVLKEKLQDKVEEAVENALKTGVVNSAHATIMKNRLTEGTKQLLNYKFKTNTSLTIPKHSNKK